MRRPAIRSLVGGAAGLAAGIIGGVTLTSLSAAGVGVPGSAAPGLEASHVPPALTLPGEPATLRYAIVCAPREDGRPCAGSGEVYVRAGHAGSYERIPLVPRRRLERGTVLRRGPAGSRVVADRLLVLRGLARRCERREHHRSCRWGGGSRPEPPARRSRRRWSSGRTSSAHLAAPTRVCCTPRGEASPGRRGSPGSRALGFAGPASFDVGADGTVTLLDQVNGRAERWARGRVEAVTLAVSGGLADFAVEPDGTMDVLEPPNRLTPVPLLRSFRGDGTARWTQRLADRTWAKLALGPEGPAVLAAAVGAVAARSRAGDCARPRRASRARAARPAARTRRREVVVDRVGSSELRSRSSPATRSCAAGASRARRRSVRCSSPNRTATSSSSC